MKKMITLLIGVLMLSNYTLSQKDTLFWFSPPSLSLGTINETTSLIVKTYGAPTQVTVSLPANSSFAPIIHSVNSSSVLEIDLTGFSTLLYDGTGGTIKNNGLKVSSTEAISVEWVTKNTHKREDFSLKGKMALGKDFYVPVQTDWTIKNTGNSGFTIVATADNTSVLITPKVAVNGTNTTTFSVMLNKGQTYFVLKNNLSEVRSLSGSIVSANKDVAVTVFENEVSNNTCYDLIGDQLISSDYLGKDFVISRLSVDDKIYILAVENGTEVTTNDGTPNTRVLSWGETYVYSPGTDFSYIESSKKVYVYHVTAKDCQMSATIVPNAKCSGSQVANSYRKTDDTFVLSLFTNVGSENDFLLNGMPLPLMGNVFTPVNGTNGSILGISLSISLSELPAGGLAQISNTSGIFGMSSYNGSTSSNGSYFSYSSDFSVATYANAGPDFSICSNVGAPVVGLLGGGAQTGYWASTGFGTFSQASNQLTNMYYPSPLDAFISPIKLILTSSGDCPVKKDTLLLSVNMFPIVNASVDQIVCANNSDVTLNGSVQGGSTTGVWSSTGTGTFIPNSNFLSAVYRPSNADLQSTSPLILTLLSTNNGSCLAENDELSLSFSLAPIVSISTDTIFVCANNPLVTLEGQVTGTSTRGKWLSNGSGMFFPNNISLNTTYQPGVNDVAAGQFVLYLESTNNGSCLPVKDSVIVIITPSPTVNAGDNRMICLNQDSIYLDGAVNAGFNVTWSGGLGQFGSVNDPTTYYIPTSQEKIDGNVLLTLTSSSNGNCLVTSDIVNFTFVEIPHVNFTVNDQCLGIDQTFVNHSLAGYGTITNTDWFFGDNTTSTISSPQHKYNNSGQFTVDLVVTNSNGCVNQISKPTIVHPKPRADFSYSSECEFQSLNVTFIDESSSGDGITAYLYDLGGQVNFTTPNFNYLFTQVGTYNVSQIVTSGFGCNDTIMKPIIVSPFPKAGFAFNFSSEMNVGTTYNFIDTSRNASTYVWNLGNGISSNLQYPSAIYFENGHYLVTQKAINNNGCFDSTSVWIEINNITTDISTLIPNVISPNGDGYNDTWKLSFIEIMYPNAEVFIFNAWGQLLFESKGYTEPWDATFKGKEVPDGNYFYVINLNNGDGEALYKGALMVLRSTK